MGEWAIKSVNVNQGAAGFTVNLELTAAGQLPAPDAAALGQGLAEAIEKNPIPALDGYRQLKRELAEVKARIAALEAEREAAAADVQAAKEGGRLMDAHHGNQRIAAIETELAGLQSLHQEAAARLEAIRQRAGKAVRTVARDLVTPLLEAARRQREKAAGEFVREAAEELAAVAEAAAREAALMAALHGSGAQPHAIPIGLSLDGLVAGALNQAA